MSTPSVTPPFVMPIVIAPGDIDELGHVNNIVYLRWAQEAATAHWRACASAAMVAAFVWVVRRHEADYLSSLMLGDVVEARTWVEPAPQGALWRRFVEVGKPGAPRPAALIASDWVLLDAASRRVRRVPAEIAARFA